MICDLLRIPTGLTSVIGSGGKTTLLGILGRELAARGRVVLCTTTKIRPLPGFPLLLSPTAERLGALLHTEPAVCVGAPFGTEGKLQAPELPMEELLALADYVIAEADGAAQRPLKAHAPHEPCIAPETRRTILLTGASGLGRPIREAVHRPEIFASIAGCGPHDPAAPEAVARVLRQEALGDLLLINQAEASPAAARRLASYMNTPVLAGELREGRLIRCSC